MNSKILIKTLIGLIVFGSFSCKKFLDQDPISTVTDATSWSSSSDVNSQIAGCYSGIRSAFNAACSFYSYGDVPTDLWGDMTANSDYNYIYQMNWGITVSSLNTYDPKLKLRVWTPFYSSIQQSNRCLYFINTMSNDKFDGATEADEIAQKKAFEAEARFCRAFNYFYMARVWGNVPLDTSYQEDISSITSDPRVDQSQILNAAIYDLNIAKANMDYRDASSTDKNVRADKGACFALLAHIYAWKGAYDSCVMACDSVISNGGYSLVSGSNYATIYNGQSDEGIFEIAQNSTSEALNAQTEASIAYFTLAAPYIATNSVPIWKLSTGKLFELYNDTTDARFKKEYTYVNSGSTKYYYCTKYSNISTVTASGVNYYLSENNIIVFRLADIYLLRAEAYASKSTPDFSNALTDLNTIRTRAGISNYTLAELSTNGQNSLLDSVTAERGRELLLEGSRYYDLVRNERITGVSKFPYMTQAQFTAGKYYWPIDPSLMTLNSGLVQTTFWQQLLTY
ncbi:RagB/SusD family nutrient uptake outer membrane protein [Rhizosphaericola mali]|uniref:RagB/SusD family nutrient uptake outer membrane protein n=1 Tax=Rhizosphaericola mali TaxID=2545455 RepID=A0A5P2G7D2_9BACT|nr:RagB/SusD family nutrient uptake outer membrane protein [Rhizosphaericola mali]QES89123.1 RagB/SusD family nutrient uptake outer membrane protein [Rhizosphaericola mali]